MQRDVQVTLQFEMTTTAMTREELVRHALEVITNAYEAHGSQIWDDRLSIEECGEE